MESDHCDWNLFGSLFLHTDSTFFDRFTEFECDTHLMKNSLCVGDNVTKSLQQENSSIEENSTSFDTDTEDSIYSLISEFGVTPSPLRVSDTVSQIEKSSSNPNKISSEEPAMEIKVESFDPLEEHVASFNENFVCDFCKNLKEMGLIHIKYIPNGNMILVGSGNLKCFVCNNSQTVDKINIISKKDTPHTEYIKCLKCNINKPSVDFTTMHSTRKNTKHCVDCRNKTKVLLKETKLKKQKLIKEKFIKGEIDPNYAFCVKCYKMKPKDQFISFLKIKHYTVKCFKCRNLKNIVK